MCVMQGSSGRNNVVWCNFIPLLLLLLVFLSSLLRLQRGYRQQEHEDGQDHPLLQQHVPIVHCLQQLQTAAKLLCVVFGWLERYHHGRLECPSAQNVHSVDVV